MDRVGPGAVQVRRGHLPPWAVADVLVNRELLHLHDNDDMYKMHDKYPLQDIQEHALAVFRALEGLRY